MIDVHAIQAFKDNYIWLIEFGQRQAVVVDPGDPVPVTKQLRERGLELCAIVVTHAHWDHVDGITTLRQLFPVPVYGPAKEAVTGLTHPLNEGQRIALGELSLQVMEVPGHTKGHIAYHGDDVVFTGDTLFGAGCGRIFDGTAEQLYTSLQRIARLPDETLNYCAHEYTESNLRFALAVEPNNPHVAERLEQTQAVRQRGGATIPAPLWLEKQTNPFLRCHHPDVIAAASRYCKRALDNELDVFTALRSWKDKF